MLANLCVGITDADIHSDHEEDGDGDTKISNHSSDLVLYSVLLVT